MIGTSKRDRDQEAEQQLARGADVFEAIARDLGVAPEEAAHVGREPEAIDAERDEQQRGAADQQPPERALVAEKPRAVRRRRGRLDGRRVERIRVVHAAVLSRTFGDSSSWSVVNYPRHGGRRCALSPFGGACAQMQTAATVCTYRVKAQRDRMIGCGGALPRMRSEALSAIIMTPALRLAESIIGMIEASTTRRPSSPRTRNSSSTTLVGSFSGPMRQVPIGWNVVVPRSFAAPSNSSSLCTLSPGKSS